jgi:AcrR family transcriptional regulator
MPTVRHQDAARRKRSWHHGNLRNEMISGGLKLLEEHGDAGLSLREAARLAGVSQTAPAHHFGDKDGLLAAIAAEGFRQLVAARLSALKDGMSKEERLRVIMRVYVEFAQKRPELFHLMFGPRLWHKGKYPELEEAATASYRLLANAVAEYLSEHGQPEAPEGLATMSVWAGMHGLATLLTDRQHAPRFVKMIPTETLCNHQIDVLLSGLAAHDVRPRDAPPKKRVRRVK